MVPVLVRSCCFLLDTEINVSHGSQELGSAPHWQMTSELQSSKAGVSLSHPPPFAVTNCCLICRSQRKIGKY